MFSYTRFSDIILQLLQNGTINEDELTDDIRKKINCIIDRDQNCIAGGLGYPVVKSIDDVDFDNVKVCIPSSL